MRRKDLDYIVIAVMLLSGLYVTVTGVAAGLLGLHQVIYHGYAGAVCAGFGVLHVALNWGRVTAYLKQLFSRPRTREAWDEGEDEQTAAAAGRREVLVGALSAVGGFVAGRLIPGRGPDLPGEARDVGALYHEWSKPGRALSLSLPDWGDRPPRFKTYPDAERIALADPGGFRGLSVEEALERRRSVREYTGEAVSLRTLSGLLWAAQGITEERLEFRAAPSAGALYPIETYAVVHAVSDLESGIYHYAVQEHELERLERGDFRGEVTQAGLYQGFLGQANVCFVLSAFFQRTRWRYHERTYRYVLLEAGHLAQNLYLAATSMGMGACAVGAFLDGALNDLLGLDGAEEAVVYLISVGQPR
ncbi:MAG: SagB family peptide dehydrogenase [Chloroflexota bacterium]